MGCAVFQYFPSYSDRFIQHPYKFEFVSMIRFGEWTAFTDALIVL